MMVISSSWRCGIRSIRWRQGTPGLPRAAFSAEAGSQPQAMAGVDVEIDFEKGLVYLDWEQYRVSCDHYVAAVRNSANTSEEPDEYRTAELRRAPDDRYSAGKLQLHYSRADLRSVKRKSFPDLPQGNSAGSGGM